MQDQRSYAPKCPAVRRINPKTGKQRIVGYRTQVWDPVGSYREDQQPGWTTAPKILGIPAQIFEKKGEAKAVAARAHAFVNSRRTAGMSIEDAHERWHKRPLDKEASRITSSERTAEFLRRHTGTALALITDEDALEYAENYDGNGGLCPSSHVEGLRSFFTFCKERSWIGDSPFRPAVVKTSKSKGNRRKNPPSEAAVRSMIDTAWAIYPPIGAGLAFGVWSGARPGEWFALQWRDLNRDYSRVRIERQWNDKTRTLTLPKNGEIRDVTIFEPAREYLRALRSDSLTIDPDAWVFPNTQGNHFQQQSFAFYWKAIKAAVPELRGVERFTPYMCTRHFCGWYMRNVLGMQIDDGAHQLGHSDDGTLFRQLYGHRDGRRSNDAADAAFEAHRQSKADEAAA